jgi:hypothetical protein
MPAVARAGLVEITHRRGKVRGGTSRVADMRRHHEEIAMLPALSLLLPFAGALWLRIKTGRKK